MNCIYIFAENIVLTPVLFNECRGKIKEEKEKLQRSMVAMAIVAIRKLLINTK